MPEAGIRGPLKRTAGFGVRSRTKLSWRGSKATPAGRLGLLARAGRLQEALSGAELQAIIPEERSPLELSEFTISGRSLQKRALVTHLRM